MLVITMAMACVIGITEFLQSHDHILNVHAISQFHVRIQEYNYFLFAMSRLDAVIACKNESHPMENQ